MNRKAFLNEFLIVLLITLVFMFINYKISFGIILGFIFSILNYRYIEYRYKNLDTYDFSFILKTFLSISLLLLPLLISFLFPDILSYVGVMIGLLVIKIGIIIEAIIKK